MTLFLSLARVGGIVCLKVHLCTRRLKADALLIVYSLSVWTSEGQRRVFFYYLFSEYHFSLPVPHRRNGTYQTIRFHTCFFRYLREENLVKSSQCHQCCPPV